MNGQTRHRNGKVTASPRTKAKVKARARENIQEKRTTTRTRLDLRIKMDSARWVILLEKKNVKELNLSVMSKRMMILRVPDWIEQLMCFAFKSANSVRWIRRTCQVRRRDFLMGVRSQRALMKKSISQRERCFSPLDVEKIDQFVDSGSLVSTCPVDYATSVPTEKVQYSMNLESVLGESLQHYDIKA